MERGVLVVGESVVDVVHTLSGNLHEYAGGSAANVAVALARLGRPTRLATSFARDHHGEMIAAHPRLGQLVLKDDVRRASVVHRDGSTTRVPCLTVEVVEPVGAGDAFAAGFLAGLAESRDEETCLRLGHAVAALALISIGDRPVTVPDAADRDRIASAPADEWAGWRVHPGDVPWRTG